MTYGRLKAMTLEATVGAEIGKTRPGVIVSRDTVGILPLAVIVPITRWQERFRDRDWMVRLEPNTENGLAKLSAKEMHSIIIALTTMLNIDLD